MGEKRRDGGVRRDKKVSRPEKKTGEKGASSVEAPKEAAPVVLKLRLFVGGLGPTVGVSDLQQRFAPLGTVHKIDLVEGRQGWDSEDAAQRGFAYVDFEASSEASLRKLFSAV
jgi:RNA recognition motif-containing protein